MTQDYDVLAQEFKVVSFFFLLLCDHENCTFAASNKNDLKKHKDKVHCTEKNFVCDLCGFAANCPRNINTI